MNNKEAKDRLILLKMSYKIRIEEEDIEALDMGAEALDNQKTGHWEETTLANGRKGIKCSNCGCEPIEDALYGYVYSNYCPNCGAKMKGE